MVSSTKQTSECGSCSQDECTEKQHRTHYAILRTTKIILAALVLALTLTLLVKTFIVLRDVEQRLSKVEANLVYFSLSEASMHR